MSKTQQSLKLRELREALVASGFVALDQQATALGLCRSTTWVVLQGAHKNSGLSAAVVNRMISCPHLPVAVRGKLEEYVREKIAGHYGHSEAQVHRFSSRIGMAHGPLSSLYLGP